MLSDGQRTYTYDAWGNPLTQTGPLSATLGTHNPLRYRGYVYDTETGLYYLQSRYYNPETGGNDDADYYGADRWGGEWKIVTPPMTYDEAKVWTATTAAMHIYGKGATWGLYTMEHGDALAMAWDLGLGRIPIHDYGRPGEFSHYHVFGRDFLGFYKHFHVWYGPLL